jgi:threonine/homoserine efflux transporter RhtA
MLFIPFFAAIMAWLTPSLREALTVGQVLGMIVMTAFGVGLATQSRHKTVVEPE